MSKKCYSHNGEDFYMGIDKAIDRIDGNGVIYEDDLTQYPASYFTGFNNIIEKMSENAWDLVLEYAGDWPDCTREQEKELIAALEKTVDAWAEKHGFVPSFGEVKNVREIKVKYYEVLNDED